MDPNLIISDEYVEDVGTYCVKRGRTLEDIMDSYLGILREIKYEAITGGEISQTLGEFIECVSLLNNQLKEVSNNANTASKYFVIDINDADSYLF